ncbi:MAG: BlaI/MecI/CopY family transcriptional regulator [Verrucomicrobia bacterium]|nr:BlaI/MecI/CopY family transcriptional regulator [Verrucomicrobiota bacterium]
MKSKLIDRFGSLQRQIMEILWEVGEASVHDVRERLVKKKPLAYTTVLTVLQKLEQAGWVKHREDGRSYIYSSAKTRTEAGSSALQNFIKQVFQGDPLLLFQHLVETTELDEKDLAELKRIIDEKRKGLK